jgi:hypothetical protein
MKDNKYEAAWHGTAYQQRRFILSVISFLEDLERQEDKKK